MERRRIADWCRWGLTIAAAVLVGTAVVSCFCSFVFGHGSTDGRRSWSLWVAGGRLEFWVIWLAEPNAADSRWCIERKPAKEWRWGMEEDMRFIGWAGGVLLRHADTPTVSFQRCGTTLLYPFLLTSVPAAILWYRARRRFGPGRCVSCGYDRRGLVGGADAKCPECGTPPTLPSK
jgi:hypothetical protein